MALAAGPGTALAADALPLTLDETVSLALRQSPTVRLAETEVERARGARKGAEPLFPANPDLQFDAGPRDQADQRGIKFSYQARIEQPLDVFGQRGRRLDAADQRIGLAQARLAAVQSEERVRARSAYVAGLVAERRLAFAERRVGNGLRVLEVARLRVGSGAASELEERLAEAELGRARASRLAARSTIEQTRTALRAILDLPATRELSLSTPLAVPPERREAEATMVAMALERRRDLLALRQEGRALDADLARLRAERLPPVSFALNAEQDSPDQYWVGPGVRVGLPLWRRNQGPIAEVEAERRRNRIAVETSEGATERELRLALGNARLRREEFALLEESVLRSVERSRDLVREGWQAGKFDIFRVLAIELELVGAQTAYLEAISALWEAEFQIDRAMGLGEDGSS